MHCSNGLELYWVSLSNCRCGFATILVLQKASILRSKRRLNLVATWPHGNLFESHATCRGKSPVAKFHLPSSYFSREIFFDGSLTMKHFPIASCRDNPNQFPAWIIYLDMLSTRSLSLVNVFYTPPLRADPLEIPSHQQEKQVQKDSPGFRKHKNDISAEIPEALENVRILPPDVFYWILGRQQSGFIISIEHGGFLQQSKVGSLGYILWRRNGITWN